jgi:hypothetical protein
LATLVLLGLMILPFCIIAFDLDDIRYQKSALNVFLSLFHSPFLLFSTLLFSHVTAETATLEVATAPCLIAFNSIGPKSFAPTVSVFNYFNQSTTAAEISLLRDLMKLISGLLRQYTDPSVSR